MPRTKRMDANGMQGAVRDGVEAFCEANKGVPMGSVKAVSGQKLVKGAVVVKEVGCEWGPSAELLVVAAPHDQVGSERLAPSSVADGVRLAWTGSCRWARDGIVGKVRKLC